MASQAPDLLDDVVLARELKDAMGSSDDDIALYQKIREQMVIKDELANTETIRVVVRSMWKNVANFFGELTEIPTLANLDPDSSLVVRHADMLASFRVVADINRVFIDAVEAENELLARDNMDIDIEDLDDG